MRGGLTKKREARGQNEGQRKTKKTTQVGMGKRRPRAFQSRSGKMCERKREREREREREVAKCEKETTNYAHYRIAMFVGK